MATRNGKKEVKPHPDLFRANGPATPFQGFEYPAANFTYTPNQFFDVCIAHHSRGVVRLVGYMIRQTLGYMDADGNPLRRKVTVSYSELEARAGVGHSMIGKAIVEAVGGGFIQCVEKGHSHAKQRVAKSSSYELRWDARSEYGKNPKTFRGFFEGDGNRTNIPNQFFDTVVPTEPLAIIKVVGSVIRFSIGYQTRQGGRRQQVNLSYKDIQNYGRIASPRHLSAALQGALKGNYLRIVEDGIFDRNAGKKSRPATYAVKWLEINTSGDNAPKREAGPKPSNRSEKGSGNAPKREAAGRSEKGSDIQTTSEKTFSKQQQEPAAAQSFLALKEAGFDEATARRLATTSDPGEITRQLAWLPRRSATVNRLGMLRRAIEERWGEPAAGVVTSQLSEDDPALNLVKHFYAEYSGHQGKPTANPSLADLEAARSYLDALLAIWPDKNRVPQWGRGLGKLCLSYDENRGGRRGVVSFAALVRSHGDEFAGRLETSKRMHFRQVEATHREAYEAEHRPKYVAFLDDLMTRYADDDPEKLKAFEARRAQKRQELEFWPKGDFSQRMLDWHDGPEGRRHDFVEFFSDEIPGFWDWDRAHNARIMS